MLVALAVPGLDADGVELAVLRAGHRVAWRAIDQDDVLTQLAQRAPEAILLADHPAVATATVVGTCDLLGVRSCLVTEGRPLSVGAQRLGLHDVLTISPDGELDVRALGSPVLATPEPVTPVPPPSAVEPEEPSTARPTSTPPPFGSSPAATAMRGAPGTAIPAPTTREPVTIAVWGPAGAPGRTTIAIGLAAELAGRGLPVCLLDADTYGGTVAPALGLLDEAPGFAAACRLAGADALSSAELDRVAQRTTGSGAAFEVLTGIGRPHRWPELSSTRVTAVLEACRAWRPIVVVDCGFNLESDEELSSDLAAPRRNAATIAALRAADHVVAVSAADPLGLARLLRSHADLLETVETASVQIVVNRVRSSVLGLDPHGQVRQTLERFAGVRDAVLIDDDADAADAALLSARPVTQAAPRSALARGLAELADRLGFASAERRRPARLFGRRRTG